MRPWSRCAAAAFLFLLPAVLAQTPPEPPEPDVGPVADAADAVAGTVFPPVLEGIEGATGQRIHQEDIRFLMDMRFQKGEVDLLGFLVGSGRTEIEATLDARLEFRVVSSERLRAVLEGESPYNATAENATFLGQAYLPADVLRATFTPELLEQFEDRQEDALERYLRSTFPELQLSGLSFAWSNTSPSQVPDDDDLFEPPITAHMSMTFRYLRVDSIDSLLRTYFDAEPERDGRRAYIRSLKDEASDPLRSRDFFSAAAYSQLVNLSAQPGWAIDVELSLPRGYEFTYFSDSVTKRGPREASLHLDALGRDDGEHKVFLASITHKRGVALTLFIVLWAVGLAAAAPVRFLYGRRLKGLTRP